jgi:hypothetical protein
MTRFASAPAANGSRWASATQSSQGAGCTSVRIAAGRQALELADAGADLDGDPRQAARRDALIQIIVDDVQDRLAVPGLAVLIERCRPHVPLTSP